MARAWDWESNTEYRDGRLYGKPGSRIIRIFYDDGTGLWSPFVGKQAIAGKYNQRIADPKAGTAWASMSPRARVLGRIFQYLSKNGGLDRLNGAEVIDGVNDIDWLGRIRDEPDRDEIMARAKRIAADDEDLNKLSDLIGSYLDPGNKALGNPTSFFNAGIAASPGKRSMIDVVRGDDGSHEGISGLIVPSRRESLWGADDRDISFLYGGAVPGYGDDDYFGSASDVFNSIYDRDSGGKYKTARALFDAIIVDNFFHSKAYESLSDKEKRLFEGVEDYDDLVDAINGFELSGINKIKGDALWDFVMNSLAAMPVTYAFDPNPSGSDIDDRLVNNAMVDKLVEGLANVGWDTMLSTTGKRRNPDNLVVGVVSIDGERVIDNAMRSNNEEDVYADTPAEGLVSGATPLFSKSTVKEMIGRNIPKYIDYRRKGADSAEAWADEGSLGAILGDLNDINSDERLKVVNDTASMIRDYADRRAILSGLKRGPGNG